jgi:hypothetical protein
MTKPSPISPSLRWDSKLAWKGTGMTKELTVWILIIMSLSGTNLESTLFVKSANFIFMLLSKRVLAVKVEDLQFEGACALLLTSP